MQVMRGIAWSCAIFALVGMSGRVCATEAADELSIYSVWSGPVELWQLRNNSTSRQISATIGYTQICSQERTWTQKTTVAPGEIKALIQKTGAGTCGSVSATVNGAFYK